MQTNIFSLLIFLLGFSSPVWAQQTSNWSLQYEAGIGFSDGSEYMGSGVSLAVGAKKRLGNSHWRVYPHFMAGGYRSANIQDVRDQYFNSVSAVLAIEYDVIRLNAFALTLSTGGLLNTCQGLKGTGGEVPQSYSTYNGYWYLAAMGAISLRAAPPEKRWAFSLTPLRLHMGNQYFAEMHTLLGLSIAL